MGHSLAITKKKVASFFRHNLWSSVWLCRSCCLFFFCVDDHNLTIWRIIIIKCLSSSMRMSNCDSRNHTLPSRSLSKNKSKCQKEFRLWRHFWWILHTFFQSRSWDCFFLFTEKKTRGNKTRARRNTISS